MTVSYAQADPSSPARRRLVALWGIRVLAVIAIAIAFYLSMVAASESKTAAGCGEGSGCERVLSSRWGQWFDMSVSRPALLAYAGILAAAIFAGPRNPVPRRRIAWATLAGLAALAALAAVWFVLLQAFVLRSFCLWCTSLHACGVLIAGCVWAGLPLARRELVDPGSMRRHDPDAVPRRAVATAFAGALISLMVLIGGQILSSPPAQRLEVREIAIYDSSKSDAVPVVPDPDATDPEPDRTDRPPFVPPDPVTPPVPTADAPLGIDKAAHPIVGPADAPHLLVVMNDYTCPHCRSLHHLLDEARKRYGDQFAVAVVTVPLNPDCNPVMTQHVYRHRNACDLARLALAVWRADPKKFPQFDKWLYEPLDAPTPEQARQYAAELVGAEALAKAEADPQIKKSIARNVELYQAAGKGKLPKLFTEGGGSDVASEHDWELFPMLERRLGIRPRAQ